MIKKLNCERQHDAQEMTERLAYILKQYRVMFNISYRAMADDIGVNVEFIYRIVNNDHKRRALYGIRSDTLAKFCTYFNVSADWVLFGIEDDEPCTI